MKFILVTVYWGEWHGRMFRDYALPSLMADGNVPALLRMGHVEWHIWSDTNEEFNVPGVRFVQHSVHDGSSEKQRYRWQHVHWYAAKDIAVRDKAVIVFLAPDQIWSDGALEFMARGIRDGAPCAIINGPRALDSAVSELAPGPALRLTGRDITRLAWDHMHPLMEAHRLDAERACTWPEISVLPIGPNAWLSRSFGHEVVMWDTVRCAVNKQWFPVPPARADDVCFVSDSDDATFLSLAPDGHFSQNISDRRIEPRDLAVFWRIGMSKVNRRLARKDIVWHCGSYDPDRLAVASAKMDRFIDEALRVTVEGGASDLSNTGRRHTGARRVLKR